MLASKNKEITTLNDKINSKHFQAIENYNKEREALEEQCANYRKELNEKIQQIGKMDIDNNTMRNDCSQLTRVYET